MKDKRLELQDSITMIIQDEFDTIHPSHATDKMVERIMELLKDWEPPLVKVKSIAVTWEHQFSCGEVHPGRSHEQWQVQADALAKGFAEGREGGDYNAPD